ncbi:MAG: barstar family protein [Ottowia sp.]|nr:barstar family protein [Ottowia sp.]
MEGESWQNSRNLYAEVTRASLTLPRTPMPAMRPVQTPINTRPDHESTVTLLKAVRMNIVQSIRAFRAPELAKAADLLGHHFLYAHCAHAQTKAEVLEAITCSFLLSPPLNVKSFDALSACLTDTISKSGMQPGFVIVLEGLPCAPKFDKEARETLLDVFRDAADFWAEKKVPFRVFYAFA